MITGGLCFYPALKYGAVVGCGIDLGWAVDAYQVVPDLCGLSTCYMCHFYGLYNPGKPTASFG